MQTTEIESENEAETSPESIAEKWQAELELAKKDFKDFNERGDKIVKRYRDERNRAESWDIGESKYNIFWSNVQVQLPALYARTPRPEIERRFKDQDHLGRLASLVLERGTEFTLKEYDFDLPMVSAITDLLLVGRGQARVRYVPYFKTEIGMDGVPFEVIEREEAKCEYVFFKDFRHSVSRCWDEVKWVAFRTYLSRDELVERFGEKVGKSAPLNYEPEGMDSDLEEKKKELVKKCEVWEIWNKSDKKVYWICKGFDKPLDVKEDPLKLKGFFPCPRPIYTTLTNESLKPVADFLQYQDQAIELDAITTKIVQLTDALRVAGVYDGSCESLARLMQRGGSTTLIPEPNWAGLVQQGGLDGAIYFLPMEQLVAVLKRLYEARDQILEIIYQITGLSDIIRGSSNPNETATAQQIKGQFGTLRIATRQAEVQRFAKEIIALQAEIIAEQFSPDTIYKISGYPYMTGVNPEDPTEFDAIIGLLRDDPQRTFRIEIETDSTLAVNKAADRAADTEYLNAVGSFMQSMGPLLQSIPELAPMVGEMLKKTARSHGGGRVLEGILENSLAQMHERLNAPPAETPPDPKMIEAQTKQQLAEMKMALDEQKLMHKQQMDEYKAQTKQQMEMQKLEAKIITEQQKTELTGQMQLEKIRAEMAVKSMELAEKTKVDTISALTAGNAAQAAVAPQAAPPPQPLDITVSLAQPRRKVILGAPDPLGNRVGEIVDVPAEVEAAEAILGGI